MQKCTRFICNLKHMQRMILDPFRSEFTSNSSFALVVDKLKYLN